jgi:hypothetical protein
MFKSPDIICEHTKAKVIKRLPCFDHFFCNKCYESSTVCSKCCDNHKRKSHPIDEYRTPKRLHKDRDVQKITTELTPISVINVPCFDSMHAAPITGVYNGNYDKPIAKVSLDFMFDVVAASTTNFVSHVSLEEMTSTHMNDFL